MAQLLSRCTPSQHAPDPATISHESLTDHVMTPASSVAKPKRRAKAFALALLPLALALTACGGSSDGDSAQAPPPRDNQRQEPVPPPPNPYAQYGQYAKHFELLDKLADLKVDIYRMIPDELGGGLNLTLSNLMNLTKGVNMDHFRELKAAYYNTIVPEWHSDLSLTSDQIIQYKEWFDLVRDSAKTQYRVNFLYDITSINDWHNYDFVRNTANTRLTTMGWLDNDDHVKGNYGINAGRNLRPYGAIGRGLAAVEWGTLPGGSRPYAMVTDVEQAETDARYITSAALPVRSLLDPTRAINAKSLEEGLLLAVQRKYRFSYGTLDSQEWGNLDLTKLRGSEEHLKKFEDEFDNTLVGWIKSGGSPFGQLSFYHENAFNPDDGTNGTNNSIGIDFVHLEDVSFFLYYYADTQGKVRRASMSRDEFMKDLHDHAVNNTWAIAGIVNGTSADGDRDAVLPTYFTDPVSESGSLNYQGVMLAASHKFIPGTGASQGIDTHMGDANIMANFDPIDGSTLDIKFENIQLTNDYLNGGKSDKQIVFNGIPIIDANDTLFGGTNGRNLEAQGHVYGRFYGEEGSSNHANGRDAVGGTFYSNLTDNSGNKLPGVAGERLYEGVFGATATVAPPAAPAAPGG